MHQKRSQSARNMRFLCSSTASQAVVGGADGMANISRCVTGSPRPVRRAGTPHIGTMCHRRCSAGRCPSASQVYRPNGRILPLPKPKFGRGDGRLGDRPAVAPSGWRETAVPMRGHRHHSRIGRANALTGRHARPACPSSGPPAAASKPSGEDFPACNRIKHGRRIYLRGLALDLALDQGKAQMGWSLIDHACFGLSRIV